MTIPLLGLQAPVNHFYLRNISGTNPLLLIRIYFYQSFMCFIPIYLYPSVTDIRVYWPKVLNQNNTNYEAQLTTL